jgi:hypothetical protein
LRIYSSKVSWSQILNRFLHLLLSNNEFKRVQHKRVREWKFTPLPSFIVFELLQVLKDLYCWHLPHCQLLFLYLYPILMMVCYHLPYAKGIMLFRQKRKLRLLKQRYHNELIPPFATPPPTSRLWLNLHTALVRFA